MVEIMLAVWLTAFILSTIVTSYNVYVTRKRLQSEVLKNLNSNLSKVELYWSNTNADFSTLVPGAVEKDAAKTIRNTFLIGILGLGSMPGFIFLLMVILSLHFLARSRKELATFRSDLATEKNLTREQVEAIVEELNQIR